MFIIIFIFIFCYILLRICFYSQEEIIPHYYSSWRDANSLILSIIDASTLINHKPPPHNLNSIRLENIDLIHVNITWA